MNDSNDQFVVDLGVTVAPSVMRDFLAKLHYVSEDLASFRFAVDRTDRIEFYLKARPSLDASVIAGRIVSVAHEMAASFRTFETKTLIDHRKEAYRYRDDPHKLLETMGELKRFGPGRYGLGPLLVRLISAFERAFLQLAQRFEAEPHQFPTLIGGDALERCKYLSSFPHTLNLVFHLREDIEAIRRFAAEAGWDGKSFHPDSSVLAPSPCLLSPSVCFHWYSWLADQRLDAPRALTAVGKCFRYESGNLSALERLWDFSMREIVFMGPRDFVLERRQQAITAAVELFDSWKLGYTIESASDPFFISSYGPQTTFQRAFELKFEACADLAYSGSSLAVASFNHHQDFFGRSFGIRGSNDLPVETGCVAFGLERLALAFLAQHGCDQSHWPPGLLGDSRG